MSKLSKLAIILLRVGIGWYFLYMGIVAILNPAWSVAPFIKDAGTFSGFYQSISEPSLAMTVSYIIKGLLVLIGGLLILGLFARIAALLGIIVILFFYFPLLQFPYVSSTYYLVDDHLIIVLALVYLYAARAGEYFGLGSMFKFSRYH